MNFMKKIIVEISSIIILIAICLSGCRYNTSETIHTAEGFYFNTFVSVKLYGCGDKELAKEAVKLCDYYEKIFSRTLADSILYKSNETQYLPNGTQEEQELYELICESVKFSEITGGGMDITIEPLSSLWNFGDNEGKVPEKTALIEAAANVDYSKLMITDVGIDFNGATIDCGAVAKGYVADRIKEFLEENGVDSGVINLGGNILCIGDKPSGETFVIGVKKPFSEEVLLGLNINDYSVVTSGTYERYFEVDETIYHHILNPDTGMPCENGLLSVTIIAESSFGCDALSTGCFVMGQEAATELINSMENVYGIFIDENYNIHYTDGAKQFVN